MDRKNFCRKILFPPIWLMVILALLSTAALIFVFLKGFMKHPIAYIVYVLSFYTLTVVCIYLSLVLPKRYKQIKQKIFKNPISRRYITDATFRTHISLYSSLSLNLLYVGVYILSFILYRSMWFMIFAGYYCTLSIMRFLLLRYVRGNEIGKNLLGELKRARLCSVILITINFALSGAVLMMLYQDKGFNYHGILIYVMAGYTFYMTIHAIIDLVKYRKYNSPVMITTKVIALSAALVSMLALETAMFSQFGENMAPENQRLMIALTGAGVSLAVITMSVYMIAHSGMKIKKIRGKKNG